MRFLLQPEARVIFTGSFVVGVFMATLGLVLPSLTASFDISLAAGGALFSLWAVGSTVGAILAGLLGQTHGYRRLALVGISTAMGTCLLLIAAPSFAVVAVAMTAAGFSSGFILAVVQGNVGLIGGDRTGILGLFEATFSLGTVAAPLIAAALQALDSDWHWAYAIVLALLSLLLAFAACAPEIPVSATSRREHEGAYRRLLRDRFVVVSMGAIFLMVSIEWSTALWLASFLRDHRGFDPAGASVAVSLFWVGMMASRLLLSRVRKRFPPRQLLLGMAALMIIAASGVAALESTLALFAGCLWLGLGSGGVFPLVLGTTMDRHPESAPTVSGMALFVASFASAVFPLALGSVAGFVGLATAMWLLPALAVTLLGCLIVQQAVR